MASTSFNNSVVNEGKKTTTKYSVDSSGMGYSIISEDIKADFDFLTTTMTNKVQEALSKLNKAKEICDAFYFENGEVVSNFDKAYQSVAGDAEKIMQCAENLRNALRKDIDNINTELDYNYGWPIGVNIKETGKTVEEVPAESE